MEEKHYKITSLKWFITIIASILILFSTVVRTMQGLEADRLLCLTFAFIGGLPWGANVLDYIKKK